MLESRTENKQSLIPENVEHKLREYLDYLETIKKIKIENDEQANNSLEVCKTLKTFSKDVEDKRKELKAPFLESGKIIDERFSGVKKPIDNAERKLKSAIAAYHTEKQRLIDEENKKAEAEAERQRQKAIEKAEKEAEKVAKYREDGREDMAMKAEARAESAMEVASTTVAQVKEVEKKKGLSFRKTWKAEVVEKTAFVEAALKNNMLLACISVDVSQLSKIATSMKGEVEFPGIKLNVQTITSVRAQ